MENKQETSIADKKAYIGELNNHKTILAMGILAHLLASLLDCHMFNMGPGLTYGVMLLLVEMLPNPTEKMATPTLQVE